MSKRLLLSVVALAAVQLVFAGHQFQHDDAVSADLCATCVQLEHFDGPVAEVSAVSATRLPSRSPVAVPVRTTLAASLPPYTPRAPPAG